MTSSLTKRVAKLEVMRLPPGLREIATAVALEEGLDPEAVIQQSMVILRQVQEAGIPMTPDALTAYFASDEAGVAAR